MGIIVDDDDLVSLALLGLSKSWHSYQDSANGREKLPDWERLWSYLVQEEFKRNTRDGSSSKNDDEEDCALATKARKGDAGASPTSSKRGATTTHFEHMIHCLNLFEDWMCQI